MPLLRRSAFLLTILAAVGGAASLCVDGVRQLCIDADSGCKPISLVREYERRMELDRLYGAAPARAERKEKIATAVLAGELTLAEAAVAFAEADEMGGQHQRYRPSFPGATEQERQCRAVIEWVVAKARFERSPAEAEDIRSRLETQLQEYLAGQGCTRQPAVPKSGESPSPKQGEQG